MSMALFKFLKSSKEEEKDGENLSHIQVGDEDHLTINQNELFKQEKVKRILKKVESSKVFENKKMPDDDID